MARHPPPLWTLFLLAATCRLLCLSLPAVTAQSAASVDASHLPASVDCGSLAYSVNVSFTTASRAYLSLYLFNPYNNPHPDTSHYGAVTSLPVTSSAANLSLSLTLSTSLPCYSTSLQWALILSSSSNVAAYGAQVAVALANASSFGSPVGCSVSSIGYSPSPPSVDLMQFDYTLFVTLPEPCNVQLTLFDSNYNWFAQMLLPAPAAVLQGTMNSTWDWIAVSSRIPTAGTSMIMQWSIFGVNPDDAGVTLCNGQFAPAFVAGGHTLYTDSIDTRSLPSVLPPTPHPSAVSSSIHLDLFVSWTGLRSLNVSLVDAAGVTLYFSDVDNFGLPAPATTQLLSYDYFFQHSGAQWNAGVTQMYWFVQMTKWLYPPLLYATTVLVPVTIGTLQDEISCMFLPQPDPTQSAFSVYISFAATGNRTMTVLLFSPSTGVTHAVGSVDWTGGATSTRVDAVLMTLQEGFVSGSTDLQWFVYSVDDVTGAELVNDTDYATALSSSSVYVDAVDVDVVDFSEPLFGSWLLQLDGSEVAAGYIPLQLNMTVSTAGARCMTLSVMTLSSLPLPTSTESIFLTSTDTFVELRWTTDAPTSAENATLGLNISTVGVAGTELSISTELLYLAAVVYNCSAASPLSDLWAGEVDVGPLLSSGALLLQPLVVSEQVDFINTALLTQPYAINVYQTTFTLQLAVSLAAAADVFVALVSASHDGSADKQWASGYTSVEAASTLSSVSLTLSYQGSPSTDNSEYALVFVLAPLGSVDVSTTFASIDARYTSAAINASLYAVQDLVDVSPAPFALAPSSDSPAVNLSLSTAAPRTLVLALVDTTSWSTALLRQCSTAKQLTAANLTLTALATSASSPVPVALSTATGAPTLLYGFATLPIDDKTQLTPYLLSIAYVQSLPASYPQLAWVSWLADTSSEAVSHSTFACKRTTSSAGTVLTNSISTSLLTVSVPYNPLSVSVSAAAVASSTAVPVQLTVGTASSMSLALSLYQLGSASAFGTAVLPLPYARNPSVYSFNVTLSSLPLAQHSDLYWQYSLTYPNGTAAGVAGSSYAVSVGSSDAVDLSALAASPELSSSAMVHTVSGAWLTPINVTASTAAPRWLYVRLYADSVLLGIGYRYIFGATALSFYTVPVLLLQPIPFNTSLVVQSWLASVSSGVSSTVYSPQTASVSFVQSGANATTAAAVDAVDVSELSQQQSIDCTTATAAWSADVNVSTASDRVLTVAYIRSDLFSVVVGNISIKGQSYMQRQRIPLTLAIAGVGLTCATLLNIQVQLVDAVNSSLVYSTATVAKVTANSLASQRDVAVGLSLPSPLPVTNGSLPVRLMGTTGATPRYMAAALVSTDTSVSFADCTTATLPILASQAILPTAMTVRQALVGGTTMHVLLQMIEPLVPSAALDWTVNWQPITFQTSTLTALVDGMANYTLQDSFVSASLPMNVDPSLSTAPFTVSLNVSTNGARDLAVQLFTNGSSGPIAFAEGVARLQGVVAAGAAVVVTMQPLLPLVYGMTNLYLSAMLVPVGVTSVVAQASVSPYLINTLSATAAASASLDSLTVSLPSMLLDTRLATVGLLLSGYVDSGHDINCSLAAVTASSATTFSYGSAVKSFSSGAVLSNTAFDIALSHLLYPNQTDLVVQCFSTPTGEGTAQAVAFSNVVHCASTNNSAVAIQIAPASMLVQATANGVLRVQSDAASTSTPTTITGALAYSSGIQPLSFRPYSAVIGSAPDQLVFWFPSSWALVTRPPAPVSTTAPLSSRLSAYISPFSALLEAVELWVLQQRSMWNATDAVSVALYAVNMSALFNTPLCTSSTTSMLAPSSIISASRGEANCPDMLLLNNDELAGRVSRNELLQLDDLFSDISTQAGRSLSDDLIRYADDGLLINSHFYSAGLVTDIRLLYYNKTALRGAAVSAPPPGIGSLSADYSRSWTWSVFTAQVQQLGLTLHGADYEELILAQMIAQSRNAQLLTTQPTDASYSTSAGEGSALTSAAYTQAMNSTFAAWIAHKQLSAAVNTSNALWHAWQALSIADMSATAPLPLSGLPTLSSEVDAFIDSLYYASLEGSVTASYVYGVSGNVSMAAARVRLPGFVFDSASLSAHLAGSNEIGVAYVPSGSGYLSGLSVAVLSSSDYAGLCSNLTALLVDNSQPYQYTIAHALRALPPYASTWSVAPFDLPEYAMQQVATTLAKPLFSPLSPLSQLPAMIAANPHRQLLANLAYKNVSLAAALTASSLSVSNTYFPLVALTSVGDSLSASQAPTYIILAVILSALGAWVASLLVEQAIFLFHRGDARGCAGWLLLTSVSLGGGGFWCSLLMQAGSLQINAHPTPDVTSLAVDFALDLAIVLAIPAILFPFMACLLMVDSLRRARLLRAAVASSSGEPVEPSVNKSTTANGSNGRNDPTVAAKMRKAAGATLTWLELAQHLAAQLNARVATAGLCMALGLWIVRLLLPHVWLVQANFHSSAAALVVTAIVDYALCTVCLLVLFHAMKGRLIGVFSVPCAMLFDYQLNTALMQWTYASDDSSSFIHAFRVSSQVISILTALLGAIVCLLFVGLQFKRMALSRYSLAQQVAKLRASIEAEKARAVTAEKRAAYARAEKDTLVRVMEFIHLARPISSEAAFLLAFCSHAESSPLSQRLLTNSTDTFAASKQDSMDLRGSAMLSAQEAAGVDGVSKHSKDSEDEDSPTPSTPTPGHQDKSFALSPKPSSRAVVAPAPMNGTPSATGRTVRQESSISGRRSATPSGAAMRSPQQQPALRLSATTSHYQAWTAPTLTAAPAGNTAAARSYENDIAYWVSALASTSSDKQLASGTGRRSNIVAPGRASSIDGDGADGLTGDFSLPSPFVTAALQFQRERQISAPLPGPLSSEQVSLDAMLLHPACVEILKDELSKIHSAENLSFYLLATRFQRLRRTDLRQWLGAQIVATYIAEGAAQQINITSRQTTEILQRHKGAHYPAEMFAEAAREVKMLISTNLKQFRGSMNHRLCCWILQASALDEVRRASAADTDGAASSESRLLDELNADGLSRGAMSGSGPLDQQLEAEEELEMPQHSTTRSKSGTQSLVH